jgi:hypothetical protein
VRLGASAASAYRGKVMDLDGPMCDQRDRCRRSKDECHDPHQNYNKGRTNGSEEPFLHDRTGDGAWWLFIARRARLQRDDHLMVVVLDVIDRPTHLFNGHVRDVRWFCLHHGLPRRGKRGLLPPGGVEFTAFNPSAAYSGVPEPKSGGV